MIYINSTNGKTIRKLKEFSIIVWVIIMCKYTNKNPLIRHYVFI